MRTPINSNPELFDEIKYLVDSAKQELASQANSILTLTYWRIGQRIRIENWLTMKIVKKHFNWWWKFWL